MLAGWLAIGIGKGRPESASSEKMVFPTPREGGHPGGRRKKGGFLMAAVEGGSDSKILEVRKGTQGYFWILYQADTLNHPLPL